MNEIKSLQITVYLDIPVLCVASLSLF